MTVGFITLLLERSLVELLQTESTDEMLRMEFPEHGRYTASRYRFVATGAQGAPFGMVVCLTVGLAFVVEEGAANEWGSTVLKMIIKMSYKLWKF